MNQDTSFKLTLRIASLGIKADFIASELKTAKFRHDLQQDAKDIATIAQQLIEIVQAEVEADDDEAEVSVNLKVPGDD